MSGALLRVCEHARSQLLREQAELSALHGAVRDYTAVVRDGARALRLVADDRDAYAYYRVGEELDLDWDFSDPEATCDMSRRLDRVASFLHSRPWGFSGAALACADKALSESLGANKELEQAVLWLRNLSRLRDDDVRDCADLIEAAGAVVDYQSRFRISMRVTAVCADGSALRALSSGLRDFADAIAR
jgi:hypothetical protein